MSMHIEYSTHWGGDVFFITDEGKVWRVWIGNDYFPTMQCLTGFPYEADYSWPVNHLRGLLKAKRQPLLTGIDKGNSPFQGSNFNPRGWGRR